MKTQNIQLKPTGPPITSTSAVLLIRLNTYRAAVLALFFAGATLLGTSAASAATITVINTNDSGPGSLRQALAHANDGDTIDFDSSLNGQRITLTSDQLVVNRSVTISGLGANNLTVDGNANGSVFYISPGNGITISGLTITNGGNSGGGINNDGAALTVSNCTISGNSGSGIRNDGAPGTVSNCTIIGNSGSGIYNSAFHTGVFQGLTVTNSTLSGNSGGGISNA